MSVNPVGKRAQSGRPAGQAVSADGSYGGDPSAGVKPNQKLRELKGVGENVGRKLSRLGLVTVNDLINFYPRRYDDFSNICTIAKAKPGPVTIKGQITRAATRRTRRRGFTITEAVVDDGTGTLKAVWFNQPYLASTLPKDEDVYLAGQLEFKYNNYALQTPVVEKVSDFAKDTARIVPVYPETAGLTSRQLRGLIRQALPVIDQEPEPLPSSIVTRSHLVTRAAALRQIHFPDTTQKLEGARYRLAFEELFILILTSLVIKQEIKTEVSPRIKFVEAVAKRFVVDLPFKLTNSQRAAAWQILQDLDSELPMNRLLEGDVGSGKTVVSALAAVMAINAGYQVALLAPTEILARQHFQSLKKLIPRSISLGLLVGSSKSVERRKLLASLSSGKLQLVVGTHALLESDVKFQQLGLAIVDEQHRFGVEQRNALKVKAAKLPHLLTMSATPIPRSLALTVYGDLDISVIAEMPPGRQPVATTLARDDQRRDVYRHIDQQIAAGRQVFVICPLISESDKLGVKSVEAEAER
ncbi:ATP-dependent DNA helicase RecG, partial [Candidatus Microgenomates bacterium]|nr:ATP-dependent DNA helicase RecG [Candidatus Microgenomates bacterium]